MDGTVPFGIVDLWRLLALHMDGATIRAIHPWILRDREAREEGRVSFADVTLPAARIVDREIRVAGRTVRDTWTYTIAPPREFTYEIRSPRGDTSTFTNTYVEEGTATRVLTDANIDFGRIPRFLQRRIGDRLLNRADDEDLSYVQRFGFRTAGEAARPKGT